MSSTSRRTGTRRPGFLLGPTAYRWLDLTGIRLDQVVVGIQGVSDMRARAIRLGFPQCTVTSAYTAFSRVHVIQLGGDPAAGTVILAGETGAPVTIALPEPFVLLHARPDTVRRMLTAIEADYPPASLTATLAASLAGLAQVCTRHRGRNSRTVPVETIETLAAAPLRAFLDVWGGPHPDRAECEPAAPAHPEADND